MSASTPVSLARVRDECGRIFGSGDSLYPSEIEFAEHVLALVEAVEAAIPLYEDGKGDQRFWDAMEELGV